MQVVITISQNHIGKFKIHGLNMNDVVELYIKYRYTYNNNSSFYLNAITPEVDENGNIYFYVWRTL